MKLQVPTTQKLITFIALIFLAISCKNKEEKAEIDIRSEEFVEEQIGKTFDFENLPDTLKAAHSVRRWNGCHSLRFADSLNVMYADMVYFYGENKYKSHCIQVKKALLTKYPDYFQRIMGGISVEPSGANEFKCYFTKYITAGGVTAPIPSYIIMKKDVGGNHFIIVAESDIETDLRASTYKDSIEQLMNIYLPSESEIKGDFGGFGKQDNLYILPPDNIACSNCETMLAFSNDQIQPITLTNTTGANILNEGDLDGDGGEEISVLPLGASKPELIVYSFKRGQWVKLATFKVNRTLLMSNVDARKQAVELAGPGYIYTQEASGDTTIQQKINIWQY